jgi:dihydroorotase
MFDLVFRGAEVVSGSGIQAHDVCIEDGKIAALVLPGSHVAAHRELAYQGKLLFPGLVDAHAHLREPGLTHKETFESGTRAALLGGVTTVLVMPTDDPYTADAETLRQKEALAYGQINVDVGFQVAMRRGTADVTMLATMGAVSFEIFTADVPPEYLHDDLASIMGAMKSISSAGGLCGISPGDQSILEAWGRLAVSDRKTSQSFELSRPPIAEATGIARAILAAAETRCRIHIRQINSEMGLGALRRLADLADVTAETTVQCLVFDHAVYETHGAHAKASPPFRTANDVEAMRAAVRDGTVSVVATDHAPHSLAEKQRVYEAFGDVPGGMAGLQTLLPVMLHLVGKGIFDLETVARVCCENPASRFGLGGRKGAISVGKDADVIVLDPLRQQHVVNRDQVSKAGYTLFDGLVSAPAIEEVYLRGQSVASSQGLISPLLGEIIRTR